MAIKICCKFDALPCNLLGNWAKESNFGAAVQMQAALDLFKQGNLRPYGSARPPAAMGIASMQPARPQGKHEVWISEHNKHSLLEWKLIEDTV